MPSQAYLQCNAALTAAAHAASAPISCAPAIMQHAQYNLPPSNSSLCLQHGELPSLHTYTSAAPLAPLTGAPTLHHPHQADTTASVAAPFPPPQPPQHLPPDAEAISISQPADTIASVAAPFPPPQPLQHLPPDAEAISQSASVADDGGVSLIPTTNPPAYSQPLSSTSVTDGGTPRAAAHPTPPGPGASEPDSDERFMQQMGLQMQPSSVFTLLAAHTWTFSNLPRTDQFADTLTSHIRQHLTAEGYPAIDISVSVSTFLIPGTSADIQRHIVDVSLMDSSFASPTSSDSDLSTASRAGQYLISAYGLSAHTMSLPITLRAGADTSTFRLHFSRGDTILTSATTHMRNNFPQAFLTHVDLPAGATRVAVVIRLPDTITRTPGALVQYQALIGRKFGDTHIG